MPGPRVETFWLDEAYVRARSLSAPAPAQPGVRLVWCRGAELGWLDLAVGQGEFAVVGRHSRCDAVLAFDPAIALRHVLVRAARLEDGTIATRFLDLKSNLGFHLDDDTEHRALVTRGPVAIRLGRYALVALPTGALLPDRRPRTELEDAPTSFSRHRAFGSTTLVMLLPPAPMLDDIVRDEALPGSARITLRSARAWAKVDVSDSALDAGVLVGRADRCALELRPAMTPSLSRTHVLLLRERGLVEAFDVASTQGLYVSGKRVRKVRLPDRGATVQLGKTEPVALEWHPRSIPDEPLTPRPA